jgi:hypothetical protein
VIQERDYKRNRQWLPRKMGRRDKCNEYMDKGYQEVNVRQKGGRNGSLNIYI